MLLFQFVKIVRLYLQKKKEGGPWETHDWLVEPCNQAVWLVPPPVSSLCLCFSVSGGSFFLVLVVGDWNDVKVHLAMAPVAVMLNLRADALAVPSWK